MADRELKQKIRLLKKLELNIRYGFSKEYIDKHCTVQQLEMLHLVWREFFDLSDTTSNKARYSMQELEHMNKEQMKEVYARFWFMVYYEMYKNSEIQIDNMQNPELLDYLGLSYDSDSTAIRKRFRELYKVCHPDGGGNVEKFLELMNIKEKYEI